MFLPIRRLIERRLLPPLPRTVNRYGFDILRWRDLRAFGRSEEGTVALLATHDLSRSGAPWVVLEMAVALTEAGYRVVLVSMAEGPMREEFETIGVSVFVDTSPHAGKKYLRRLAAMADFAIANTVVTAPIVTAWTPYVQVAWYLHEISLLQTKLADGSISAPLAAAESVWAGSELCSRLILPLRSDVVVFPYGVAAIDAPALPQASRPYRIAVFGSIEPRKGQDFVVNALPMLDEVIRGAIQIDFYGRILDAQFARKAMAKAADYPQVRFHGEVDRAGYLDALRGVDAILVSSRDDTLPLVSIDALGAGRLLMLLPGVGTAQWLSDGVDALIAGETGPVGVADLIRRGAALGEKALSIATAGRDVFEREFSQATFRRKLLALLEPARRSQRNT
jgi:glycosyltransferase involved in cell wall biosynthesis